MPEEKEKPSISFLKVLAQGSSDKARDLLKKYGRGDAANYKDLEEKLAKLYQTHPDKIELEKEFIEIHPHKEFLKKYDTPMADQYSTKIELKEPEQKSDKFNTKDGNGNNYIAPILIVSIASVAIVGIVGLLLYYHKNK